MDSKHLAYVQHCCDELQCTDLSCKQRHLFLLVHNTGKSLGSEIHTLFTLLGVSNYGSLTCNKEEAAPDFNPNAVREFISVREDIGGLPMAGNRDWRVNRASLKVSWSTGQEEPPVCQRNERESTLVLCSSVHASLFLSRCL